MKILIIDGHQKFGDAQGELNAALCSTATDVIRELGYKPTFSYVDKEWNKEEEAQKWAEADFILIATQLFWFSTPYRFKQYIDEVLIAGYGTLFSGDGRSTTNDNVYGSGGLKKDTRYMLVYSANAPMESFTDPEQFFHGKGIEEPFMSLHYTMRFLGMQAHTSFPFLDVYKNETIKEDMELFKNHLKEALGS